MTLVLFRFAGLALVTWTRPITFPGRSILSAFLFLCPMVGFLLSLQHNYTAHEPPDPITQPALLAVDQFGSRDHLLSAASLIQSVSSGCARITATGQRWCYPLRIPIRSLIRRAPSPEVRSRNAPFHDLAVRIEHEHFLQRLRRKNPRPPAGRIVVLPSRSLVGSERRGY